MHSISDLRLLSGIVARRWRAQESAVITPPTPAAEVAATTAIDDWCMTLRRCVTTEQLTKRWTENWTTVSSARNNVSHKHRSPRNQYEHTQGDIVFNFHSCLRCWLLSPGHVKCDVRRWSITDVVWCASDYSLTSVRCQAIPCLWPCHVTKGCFGCSSSSSTVLLLHER